MVRVTINENLCKGCGLCVSTGLPMSALLGTLMKLELTGRVYKQPGQRYVLR